MPRTQPGRSGRSTGRRDVARDRVEALRERAARDPEALRRHVSRAVRVPAPDLEAVQPEPLGEVVHLRLDGEGRLEVAVAPHRARVHVVRVDDRRVEADVRAAVEAGERRHHDVRGRRPPGHVGAVVDQDPGVARRRSVPSARAAVRSVKTHGSRVGLATNSSSRSNTIFTGRLTCRARSAAMMSIG